MATFQTTVSRESLMNEWIASSQAYDYDPSYLNPIAVDPGHSYSPQNTIFSSSSSVFADTPMTSDFASINALYCPKHLYPYPAEDIQSSISGHSNPELHQMRSWSLDASPLLSQGHPPMSVTWPIADTTSPKTSLVDTTNIDSVDEKCRSASLSLHNHDVEMDSCLTGCTRSSAPEYDSTDSHVPHSSNKKPQNSRRKSKVKTKHSTVSKTASLKAQVGSGSTPVGATSKRAHAEVERRYRDNLNALIQQLQGTLGQVQLPSGLMASVPPDSVTDSDDVAVLSRASTGPRKADTLLAAIRYINETQVNIRHMTEEIHQLRACASCIC